MSRKRRLESQFHYAILSSTRYGHSKHADKLGDTNTMNYIYSYRSTETMLSFSKRFSGFIEKEFPQTKWACSITPEIAQAYLNAVALSYHSLRSQSNERYLLRKLIHLVNRTYHASVDLSTLTNPRPKKDRNRLRDIVMSRTDFYILNESALNSPSRSRFIPMITYTIGTRIDEAIQIRPSEIDLKKKRVELTHCKNGRDRYVPIDPDFYPFWKEIRSFCFENNWPTVAGGIKAHSALFSIRNMMNSTGLTEKYSHTSNHAIRKLYARRRLKEELTKNFDLSKAWSKVQIEIGHNAKCRWRLFRVYTGMTRERFLKEYGSGDLSGFIL